MDKFTKNALIACAITCAIVIVFFYVGSALGYKDIAGTDGKIERQAAESGNKEVHTTFYELSENGEYVVFLLAGMIGGFIVGYAWTIVFDEAHKKGGKALG
ncbi:MAG: hypothetical protein ACXVIG_00595 [Halobacteriota archaeon]